ncbi:Ran GTPase-activating protein 1-like [Elysia marginata]|uniref:Ran GTPase-activating protein 1-like n=1 Tax=Elysia marginata TaxID=1093978 RepID=A0AAV4IN36_9GAST|nr:Ran GTPase-activating protein 1-like [Elysia marginata]
MAGVDELTKQLAQTNVDSTFELSFKKQGRKLNKAEDAKEIVDAIQKCDHMTALCLEGNTLGVEAAEAISKALGQHPEFQRALWSDMFTGRLKTEIPQALKFLGAAITGAGCNLVELDLSDNAFGPNGVVGLVDLLKSSSCYSLQELKLNNNGLGIGGGKMLAECLLECHEKSVQAKKPLSLRVFISGRNRLENDGATALAKAFKAIGTLEFLAMPQNGINHPGISALADAIGSNPRLKHLNLNDNTFTAKGAQAIAKALPKLEKLETINFGDCLIRTAGAQAIAGVLKHGLNSLQEPEEETEGDISEDPKLQIKGSALTPNKQTISVKDFLTFPSPSKLLQLGRNGGEALLQELGSDKNDMDKIVSMIMKVSVVVSKDDEAKVKACECADSLLKHALTTSDNAGILAANAFLVAMGLLKSEDKKRKTPSSITGPLLVLEHVVRQSYFPKIGREILLVFISKPHPMLDKSADARHKMLQTLHGF